MTYASDNTDFKKLATGVEPATLRLQGGAAQKRTLWPLSYASANKRTVRAVGFEPTTTRSQSAWHEPGLPTPLHDNHTATLQPSLCGDICGRTRTCILRFWRPTLRQLSYTDLQLQMPCICTMTSVRFERTTDCISGSAAQKRSSHQIELRGQHNNFTMSATGIEPATPGLKAHRSDQLSYADT